MYKALGGPQQHRNWAWGLMPAIPTLEEAQKLKASLAMVMVDIAHLSLVWWCMPLIPAPERQRPSKFL